MRAKDWVARHAAAKYSQDGEDGLLEAIFATLEVEHGFCVDIGAWDGIRVSNTFNLVRKGWRALLIEGDRQKYRALVSNMRAFPGVICRHALVSTNGPSNLDAVLAAVHVPRSFELLSIDVDGIDYYIWQSLTSFSPKVVVIEYNPTIPNDIEYVQRPDPRVAQGSSIRSLAALAAAKGYELTATTETNAVFVRRDLFPRLNLEENTLTALRDDTATKTTLFQGFDGTLMLAGNTRLLWHDLPIDERRMQVVPRLLRRHPQELSAPMQALRYAWAFLYLARTRRYHAELGVKMRRMRRRLFGRYARSAQSHARRR